MLLDSLRDFEWSNEPKDVSFNEQGMIVVAKSRTDFWQNEKANISKDNGHFFFAEKSGDFDFKAKWSFDANASFEQCGIMMRLDQKNWFKISIMSENIACPKLGSVTVNDGNADLAVIDLRENTKELWYKATRRNGDFMACISYDGINFSQIRMFSFVKTSLELKVGAYICSPLGVEFSAILSDIEISQ